MREIHRRNLNRLRHEGAGDLADINEQELAKDNGRLGHNRRAAERAESKTEERADTKSAETADEQDIIKEIFGESTEEQNNTADDRDSVPMSVIPADVSHCDESAEKETEEIPAPDLGAEETSAHSKKKSRRGGGIYVFVTVACLVAALGILLYTFMDREDVSEDISQEDTESVDEGRDSGASADIAVSLDAEEIYACGAPSSVTVIAEKNGEITYSSGTVLFADGYIATLWETVAEADRIRVLLHDGSVYEALEVGSSSTADLALLKIPCGDLKAVSVARDDTVSVGDKIYAIGALMSDSFGSSLCSGEVSFCKRELSVTDGEGRQTNINAIQMSIHGDSVLKGCPVFNERGEAIAIMLSVGTEAASFALPFEAAAQVLQAIRLGEEPSEDVLSSVVSVTPKLGIMGERFSEGETCGVSIVSFTSQESDSATKLRVGDLIVRIDQTEIRNTSDIKDAVKVKSAGDNAEVFVLRDGQCLSFYVTLGEK